MGNFGSWLLIMKASQDIQKITQQWLERVVIGYNFCPFAKAVLLQKRLRYRISTQRDLEAILMELVAELDHLEQDPQTETTLLIFAEELADFEDYLDSLAMAEALLVDLGYEGIYQLASFHPDYQFEGEAINTSYTNRSPYPMWHLLREASIEQAIAHHPNPAAIPTRNAALAAQQSATTWASILRRCYELEDH